MQAVLTYLNRGMYDVQEASRVWAGAVQRRI
jgi:hypothetical protein